MLNKKYLFLMLFLAVPSFSLMNSKEARKRATKVNEQKAEKQLPNLLREINEAIENASTQGDFSAWIEVNKYNLLTVSQAEDILSREGYTVSSVPAMTGNIILDVEW